MRGVLEPGLKLEAQELAKWISAQDRETLVKMVMFLATKNTKSLNEVKERLNAAKLVAIAAVKTPRPYSSA